MADKIPPYSAEDEMAVLGACFLQPRIIPKVAQVLCSGDLYLESHGYLFDALVDLGTSADPVSVADWLKRRGLFEKTGAEDYIFKICDISTSAGWEYHAKVVKEMSIRRRIIGQCSRISDRAHQWHDDTDSIVSEWKESARDIDSNTQREDFGNKALYTRIYEDLNNDEIQPGFKFGIQNIDDFHHLEKGCTTVVAAESGTGKSAFCLQVADYVSRAYGHVLYFSMESTREKLGTRQIARYSNIALTRLQKKNFQSDGELEKIHHALSDLIESNLTLIDNTAYQVVENLASFCESYSIDNEIKLIIVDYLQLLSSRENPKNRHLEISTIAKKLNFLAKDLGVPVIYVSQLGKDIEKRSKNRPMLGDLKESGDIRNHADNIIFLYAPDPSTSVYPVECFLGKGKDQEGFKTWLEFNGHYQRFSDGDEPDKPLVSYGGYDG